MSTLLDKVNEIKTEKDTYIIPGNLKQGVTAFGVEGALEQGAKLFASKALMDADPNASLGDKALIYANVSTPVDRDSEFSSCTFPQTVVLDEAFSGYSDFMLISTGEGYFDGIIEVDSSYFRFDGWGESGGVSVRYESQDGITYTRTDGGEETVDFGTTVMFDGWNPVIGNFMKIQTISESALYEYKNVRDEDYIQYATDLSVVEDDGNLLLNYTYETYYAKDILDILKANCAMDYNDAGGFLIRNNTNEYSFIYGSYLNNLRVENNKLFINVSNSEPATIATINISNNTINKNTTTVYNANIYLSNIDISSVVVARYSIT